MPRSFRIWAPKPTSSHWRWRSSSEPSAPGHRLDRHGSDTLDQFLPRAAIGDGIGNRNAFQPVRLSEVADLRAGHDRAVVLVYELADHADRRQAGELTEIDGGFGVAGAH